MRIMILTIICSLGCISNSKKISSPVKTRVPAIFEELSPKTEIFFVNPETEQKITTKNGSIITFPKDAFILPFYYKNGTLVKIEFKEYNSTPEFLSTGYSLSFIENNSPKSLESAGMFDIKALYNNSEVNLNKKIEIKIPNVNPGIPFNLYKIENNEWVYSGKNSQITQTVEPKYQKNVQQYSQKTEKLFREFREIDKLTTWNFDVPTDNSCISILTKSLTVNESNLIFYSVYSTTKLRFNFKWDSSTLLNIMVPTDDVVNIIFWFENKISIIKGIQTPSAPLGLNRYPSSENCLNKGEQILNFQAEDLFKDPQQRNQFLFSP